MVLQKPAADALRANPLLAQLSVTHARFWILTQHTECLRDEIRGGEGIFGGTTHLAGAETRVQRRFKIIIKIDVLTLWLARPADRNAKNTGGSDAHEKDARELRRAVEQRLIPGIALAAVSDFHG
ncbi:hypothetical protein D3C78_619270 [compost metagenome]